MKNLGFVFVYEKDYYVILIQYYKYNVNIAFWLNLHYIWYSTLVPT